MNRKLAGGIAALVVVVAGVWFFFLRGDDDDAKPTKSSRSGKLAIGKPAAQREAASPMTPRWSLDADPEGPLRLEGQVVDDDGHGVAGAEVWISTVPPRTTKSEGDGGFAFDKLVGREYSLAARSGDLLGRLASFKLTATSDPVVIRVSAGAKVIVRVADDAGKPISGAQVKLVAEGDRVAQTSGDGTATLKPIQPGWVAVQVSASGYAPASAFAQVGSAGATGQINVTLHKGVGVAGRVIDESGKPIAKVRVTTSSIFDLPGGIEPAITDDKGQFAFAALPPGTHTLVAADGEHAPSRSTPITVGERPITGIEIVMKPGGVLAGIVVDDIGRVVPYATIRVAGEGNQMWLVAARQATSDKAGSFEIRGLARAKLQARAESDVAASKIESVDLTSEPIRKDMKLVLDVKGTISGIVVNEANQPVPEVQVNAFPDVLAGATGEGLSLIGMSSATTDGAGAFTIHGLPDGDYRVWAARAAGGQREWGEQGVKAKTGDKNVKVTLTSPGTVVGTLVLETGSAPKLAAVRLGQHPSTPSSSDGTFKLLDVAPGKHDLRIHGAEFAEFIQRDVNVQAGKTTDLGTIKLLRGRKLVGRVVDPSGAAVAGAKVKVGDMLLSIEGAQEQMDNIEQMYGAHSALTDQDGQFTLTGISKKRTNVIADHPARGRSHALSIPEGIDDPPPITLALRGFGTIVGKVTSKGKAIGGASITDTPKGGGTQIQVAQSQDDGTFTFTKAAEGTHVLSAVERSVFGTSLKSTSVTVQVTAGKETKTTIDIPVGTITLAVQVKAQPGQKVDSAQVFLFRGAMLVKTAKDLVDGFLGGSVQGMKFWWGAGKPLPEFDELVAGEYSICTVPITGDLSDGTFAARLNEHKDTLKVYCKGVRVTPSPQKQTVVHEVPAMTPLPAD